MRGSCRPGSVHGLPGPSSLSRLNLSTRFNLEWAPCAVAEPGPEAGEDELEVLMGAAFFTFRRRYYEDDGSINKGNTMKEVLLCLKFFKIDVTVLIYSLDILSHSMGLLYFPDYLHSE